MADFQRLGGARGRGRVGAVRRRWPRMRSMIRGSVMNATMRIPSPQRGHASGSTSNMRRSNSA